MMGPLFMTRPVPLFFMSVSSGWTRYFLVFESTRSLQD
uniref:Uncharacterized protein n=1 Tax=Arundo donax TaxID=35708 RepID=A0A0A8ZSS1_ARUDO